MYLIFYVLFPDYTQRVIWMEIERKWGTSKENHILKFQMEGKWGDEMILKLYFPSKFSSQIGRIWEENEGKENLEVYFLFTPNSGT